MLASTKSNLARPPESLAFSLEAVPGGDVARVRYEGTSGHPASALLSVPHDDEAQPARHEAEQWLGDLLAAGPVAARDALARARADGIAERTLKRARASLGIVSERTGGRWYKPSRNGLTMQIERWCSAGDMVARLGCSQP